MAKHSQVEQHVTREAPGPLERALRRVWRSLPQRQRRNAAFHAISLVAPRPTLHRQTSQGAVTVAGFLSLSSGLGQGARLMLRELRNAGVPAHGADLTSALRQGDGQPLDPGPMGPGTLIVHVNAPMIPWALWALGRKVVAQKWVVGYWAWELPKVPREWDIGYGFVHEVWTPSEFCARALRRSGTPSVAVLPHRVAIPLPCSRDRQRLGLPEDAFVALCMFDCGSSIERKNPLASLLAFERAFAYRTDCMLVLKTVRTQADRSGWQEVVAAAAKMPNVRIIDREMTTDELMGLMRASDCLLSLHRSEGFGLVLAEAMALALPVVATAWSGSLEYMTPATSQLVNYKLVRAKDRHDVYSNVGSEWAEADVDHAASYLRELAASPQLRQIMGARAREAIASRFSKEAYVHRLLEYLRQASLNLDM
jgi:glycosyltransferase involved in cell wall biosynthesis